MNVYIFDADGNCIARHENPHFPDISELIERECGIGGAADYAISELAIDIRHARLVNGELADVPPPPRSLDYRERRFLEYPPLGDQLDALWHAMRTGTLPMVAGFYDRIAAVKAANPKE